MTDTHSDDELLASFGYQQQLSRKLHFGALWALAFSTISITTGIVLNYGFGLANFGPASIWTWPVAVAGQLLVAFVVAELGTRIPLAGYSYQWGRRLIGPGYGWFLGWTALVYMWCGCAAISLLVTAPFLESVFGWDSTNGRLTLFLALLLLAVALMINVISVQLTARVNNVAVATEIVGMVGFAVAVFFAWVVRAKPAPLGAGVLTDHAGHGLGGFALAGLLGIFTVVGFEFAADLAEETVNPRKVVPRAIIIAVVSSGVLGMLALVGFTLGIADVGRTTSESLPLMSITEYWLGHAAAKAFAALVFVSTFAVLVVALTAGARLMFSMARDNVLPGSGVLRRVSPTTHTPVAGLVASALITALFVFYADRQTSAFGTLSAAASTLPYLAYLMVVLAYSARSSQLPATPEGTFTLGRWRTPIIVAAVVWLVVALLILTVPEEFRQADWVVLGAEALGAVWYVLGVRRRVARGEIGWELASEREPVAAPES